MRPATLQFIPKHADDSKPVPLWRETARLLLWIYLMFPVGLWKLWKEPKLSTALKWRILLYGFLIPVLAYLAYSLYGVNKFLARSGL